jgi:hypothetical protein
MRENRIVSAASMLHAAWGIHLLSFMSDCGGSFLMAGGNPPVASRAGSGWWSVVRRKTPVEEAMSTFMQSLRHEEKGYGYVLLGAMRTVG